LKAYENKKDIAENAGKELKDMATISFAHF